MAILHSAHPHCWTDVGHVCQRPSGKACIEPGCDEDAGTAWGPLWCPNHDVERLERIDRSLRQMARAMGYIPGEERQNTYIKGRQ